MRPTRATTLILLVALLAPALGWKGELAASVVPIGEVLQKAEAGDTITVEGTVLETFPGSGSYVVAVLEDKTGQVQVAVHESLRRKLEPEPGESAIGQRFRVSGRWDHGYLNQDSWGIRAQRLERVSSY